MDKMKITFINPPQTASKYKFMGVIAPPLSLAYMAAVLEENDFSVEIIDAAALDMSWDHLKIALKESNPDIIAITALTPTIEKALETAKLSKNTCPKALIVLGGYHPTFNYEEVLANDFVNVVIRGEGEYTMLDLAKTFEKGENLANVKGIAFEDVVTSERELIRDLDELPYPARHLLPMDKYKLLNMDMKMSTMITSRGCPMQCSFCSSAAMHGTKLRLRSIESIINEMEYLIKNFNVETIAFMDDTFTLNKKRVIAICDEIIKRDLKIFWGCTARVDSLDKTVLKKMKEAGCITLFLGVESADQQILNGVGKKITLKKVKEAFKICKEEKIRTIASVAFGMPGDTHKNIKKTIQFVKDLKPSYAIFSLATPYPGTKFYKQAFESNMIKIKDWSKYNLISPIVDTLDCSLDDLRKYQTIAFCKFYLRPKYIISQLIMDGPIFFKTIVKAMKHILIH